MILSKIIELYHYKNGVYGYRGIQGLLKDSGHILSVTTVHKYMNGKLELKATQRKRKPHYTYSKPHKIFENKLNRNFNADKKNQKWCIDFTYLYLKNRSKRFNCTIIDLYDRSVVASITDRSITSELAKRTLEKALTDNHVKKNQVMLHSDQGSQFTSKDFIDYCESVGVEQSMSRAGCPYDNAPMERYFNTLKNEYVYYHEYNNEQELYTGVEEFAYVEYNHKRRHSYNKGKTPFEKRSA